MSEMSEQDGMGKCQKCRSNGGARWDGKMSEMSEQSRSRVDWENVGAELEQGGKEMVYDTIKEIKHEIKQRTLLIYYLFFLFHA